jgi:hypothetical protein
MIILASRCKKELMKDIKKALEERPNGKVQTIVKKGQFYTVNIIF